MFLMHVFKYFIAGKSGGLTVVYRQITFQSPVLILISRGSLMKTNRQSVKRGLLAMAPLALTLALVEPSLAGIGTITKADLSGSWQIALSGKTGCGMVAMLANVSLNSAGVGTGTLVTHGDCGDSSVPGQTFTVISLGTNGSGTANLTCGVGCGWNLRMQVSPDRSTFNVVDVDPVNPGNFISGTAVHQ
jgi:hypothetical protein